MGFVFAGLGGLLTVFVTAIPAIGLSGTSDTLKQISFLVPNYAAAQVFILKHIPGTFFILAC
jgi:hypothetical protein